ncbi:MULTISPECIES: hypothetical protein [unclassified Sphingomonas]|uniref:hypothetical protein n=1 Tax=unclassified Sphingomonas TaxID=196159 RepID=UPI0012E3E72E|nr:MULTISPECIES: hypothetical protein [unclassified Sphingomonas]
MLLASIDRSGSSTHGLASPIQKTITNVFFVAHHLFPKRAEVARIRLEKDRPLIGLEKGIHACFY